MATRTKKGEGTKDAAELRFEEGMVSLEEIVARLESGDLALEDAIREYEQGVKLVRQLNDKLTEAERKIEALSRAGDGTLRLSAIEEEEEE